MERRRHYNWTSRSAKSRPCLHRKFRWPRGSPKGTIFFQVPPRRGLGAADEMDQSSVSLLGRISRWACQGGVIWAMAPLCRLPKGGTGKDDHLGIGRNQVFVDRKKGSKPRGRAI